MDQYQNIIKSDQPDTNIHMITDIYAPELDVFGRLKEPQLMHFNEPFEGLFIAESLMVVERALDAGYEPVSFLIDTKQLEKEPVKKLLVRCPDIPIYTSDNETMTHITGYAIPRGVLCAMRRRTLPDPEELIEKADRIVVLERVTNPTNLGAIIRSAAALGMDAIILSLDCTDPLYRRTIRVSVGTVFQIPWTMLGRKVGRIPKAFPRDMAQTGEVTEEKSEAAGAQKEAVAKAQKDASSEAQEDKVSALIQQLKERGFYTVATALTDQSVPIDQVSAGNHEKLAVVLGSEGDGLRPETIAACDASVIIPMAGGVDSLNVAAASAVAFWELRKRK